MQLIISASVLAILLVTNISYSQELAIGKWGGYIIVSSSDEKQIEKQTVSLYVEGLGAEDNHNQANKITMEHKDKPFEFKELDIKDGKIIFKLDTGTLYDCDLSLQGDGSYSGDCMQQNEKLGKNKISIMMTPPKGGNTK